MERKEIKRIDSLLQSFLKSNKLEKGFAEYRLTKSWKDLLGVSVAKKTKGFKDLQPHALCHTSFLGGEE